jgi:hypothetical protein
MAIEAVLRGVIHGKTIELEQEPGLPDGQSVSVTVHPIDKVSVLPPGEGIRQSAGAWAEDAESLDEFLEWNRRQRKAGRDRLGSQPDARNP